MSLANNLLIWEFQSATVKSVLLYLFDNKVKCSLFEMGQGWILFGKIRPKESYTLKISINWKKRKISGF